MEPCPAQVYKPVSLAFHDLGDNSETHERTNPNLFAFTIETLLVRRRPASTFSCLTASLGGCRLCERIGVVEGRDGDGDIDHYTQEALEIVALLISQEVAHRDDGQQEHGNVKDLKLQAHLLVQAPAHDHDQGTVEEGSLE